ncbi:pentatricopeptide repeat-containing protein At5g50390, chloroplastic [Nymphaea colorata]|uniref:DYW domain-containing protein n=1 Tax=Nymphaea colorata TaxID=210225 RepID=A0A5K0W198_9MAGN|nr:pentatricopeptide repeat-containing protein At5g50390, chloroplastic [Nymphaea colorata]
MLAQVHSMSIQSQAASLSLSLDPQLCIDWKLTSSWLESFPTKRRKPAVCFSLDRALQPKPTPRRIQETFDVETSSRESSIKESSLSVCDKIDRLVSLGRYSEALEWFEILEIGSEVVQGSTYESLVNACLELKSIRAVKRIQQHMVKNGFQPDRYLVNRVLLVYVRSAAMAGARQLFEQMPNKDLISFNMMITGFVDSGEYEEALILFLQLWEEVSDASPRTFASVLRACAGLANISIGKQFHCCLLKMKMNRDIFIDCALIDMYGKCGSIKDAQLVFDEMPKKTVVGWNSIIAAYALHGYSEKAMDLYYEMQHLGVKMDHFTYSMVVRLCVRLASHEHAKQAHAGLIRNGYGLDIVANTALVDFYSKWGRLEDARHVFDNMVSKSIISWNALIAGYGNHGRGGEAVELFELMLSNGMRPNHVTFLAVLSACSYSGLWEQGWHYFESMTRDFKLKPRAMHYACMIELLGREGHLDEAFALIRDAPFKPTKNMWAALLTACRMHKNLELGKFAAEKLFGMEPNKLNNYALLLNIYSSTGKVEDAAMVREALRRRGLRLLPACSWIEINKRSHGFVFGDKSHPQSEEIYQKLEDVTNEIRTMGYASNNESLLPDVQEQEEHPVSFHSEKLAVSFGLISTPDSTPLNVVQSHRICRDCHDALKLIAAATGREIVVRDASRFHHFKHGNCSCANYW